MRRGFFVLATTKFYSKKAICQLLPKVWFFITNRPDVALVAEKYGVDRIWVDLEVRGKEQRQHNLNTVKSHHSISDIAAIKPLLTRAEMMVRINSWYEGSQKEIDDVIEAGADIIMLPYWKTVQEVRNFIDAVHGRCRTNLLLETKEAVESIDEVLAMGGFDEIHIGLNKLLSRARYLPPRAGRLEVRYNRV